MTLFYCGFADNPFQGKELTADSSQIPYTQQDSAIRIGNPDAIQVCTAGESGLESAKGDANSEWKLISCEVKHETKLVKEGPKPRPAAPKRVLIAASRGGNESRLVAMSVPTVNTSFKSYMDYRCITNQASKQWKLQQKAYTNDQGFRMIGDDYLVALGTYYTGGCGERFRVTLSSGKTFTVMTGDVKSNAHTNETRQYCPRSDGSGNMIEFIIDSRAMSREALRAGNLSCLGLEGTIVKIEKVVS